MPEISLDSTAVVAIVGELVPRAMAQNVAVDQEPEFSCPTSPRDHPLISGHAERRAALADKQVEAFRRFALESAQGPQLLAAKRVDVDQISTRDRAHPSRKPHGAVLHSRN